VRPNALAVLILRSNLVGPCTGRSAGFSPLMGASRRFLRWIDDMGVYASEILRFDLGQDAS
jgi:hypothetical protein